MHRVLAEIGSIYVHLDYRMVHYVKLIMDEIFGRENFRNEIVWHYFGTGKPIKHFKRKHDNILFYTKSDGYTFNWEDVAQEYTEKQKKKYTRKDEKGYYKEYRHSDGTVYRKYLTENEKIPVDDVWNVPPIQSWNEKLPFPTQKPEKFLERIILASSNEGDIVADFFCGSGTTLAVAEKLNRYWIGVDIYPKAIQITAQRLKKI